MKLSSVLKNIADFGRVSLKGDPLDYLIQERKLTEDLIEEFELGYYPFNVNPPVDSQWLQYHRLICKDDNERLRSPFEGRILFPIRDTYGKLVSIQARRIDNNIDTSLSRYNDRKYYHSSFDKSRIIYNLHRAIPKIRQNGKLIITEGQFDVITAYKYGIKNITCTTGTVLNEKQMGLLCRYATDLMIIFDGDKAGIEALKKIKAKVYAGLRINSIILPSKNEKIDLDSYLQKYGRGELIKLFKKTTRADKLIQSLNFL